MFPTAHSTVYRNEEGEVLYWENVPEMDQSDIEYDWYEQCEREDQGEWVACDRCGTEYDESREVHTKEECDSFMPEWDEPTIQDEPAYSVNLEYSGYNGPTRGESDSRY